MVFPHCSTFPQPLQPRQSRRACREVVERGRHDAQPGWAIALKSFISAPRELVPLRRQPINKQPESCSAKLASNQSTSYIVKKQGDPLIWTALRGTSPCASCPLLRKAERWPVAGWGDGRQPGKSEIRKLCEVRG